MNLDQVLTRAGHTMFHSTRAIPSAALIALLASCGGGGGGGSPLRRRRH